MGSIHNSTPETILIYGRKNSTNWDTGLYRLEPGRRTPAGWDADGLYVPRDRRVIRATKPIASGPLAIKFPGNALYNVAGSGNPVVYETPFDAGAFSPNQSSCPSNHPINICWPIPNISQSDFSSFPEVPSQFDTFRRIDLSDGDKDANKEFFVVFVCEKGRHSEKSVEASIVWMVQADGEVYPQCTFGILSEAGFDARLTEVSSSVMKDVSAFRKSSYEGSTLVVQVNQSDFDRSQQLVKLWSTTKTDNQVRNCIGLAHNVAVALSLFPPQPLDFSSAFDYFQRLHNQTQILDRLNEGRNDSGESKEVQRIFQAGRTKITISAVRKGSVSAPDVTVNVVTSHTDQKEDSSDCVIECLVNCTCDERCGADECSCDNRGCGCDDRGCGCDDRECGCDDRERPCPRDR
ncbi:hypothetical protein AB1K70_26550 [Bremerella sp. JC770]|uniref:hypothetical protein n=1 Tax=Bremerella sp. JC770 TaxID=3232137 RepID=UPI003458B2FC